MLKLNKMVLFYSEFIKPGDLCFDVGANVGNRTSVFLQLGAHVVSIEPQPNCVKKLCKKFTCRPTQSSIITGITSYENSTGTLKILETGIGEKDTGRVKLNLTRSSTIASMNSDWINAVKQNRFKNYKWNKSIEVPITNLDKIILFQNKIPHFIKIDVEGYELNVLKGLHHRVKYISFEFVPEIIDIAIGCVDYLKFLSPNYVFNYSFGESMKLECKIWVDCNTMKDKLLKTKGSKSFGDVYVKLE